MVKAAIAAGGEPDDSGWLVLRLHLEDISHAESQLLMLGADAVVVEPAELRDRIAAAAEDLVAAYGRGLSWSGATRGSW